MQFWLWVVGITAVVWPVLWGLFTEHRITEWSLRLIQHYQSQRAANAQAEESERQIKFLQDHIEKQDALVAALWHKAFGFYPRDYGQAEMNSHLGISPEWKGHTSDPYGPADYLYRVSPYPWGTHPKTLTFRYD